MSPKIILLLLAIGFLATGSAEAQQVGKIPHIVSWIIALLLASRFSWRRFGGDYTSLDGLREKISSSSTDFQSKKRRRLDYLTKLLEPSKFTQGT